MNQKIKLLILLIIFAKLITAADNNKICNAPESFGYSYYPLTESCSNWYTSVEGLAWKGTAEGIEFAIVDSMQTFTKFNNISGTFIEPAQKYHPGFRLGVGYTIPNRDDWDVHLAYTNFNMTDCGSITARDNQVLIGTRSAAIINVIIDSAKSNWTAKLNVIDFEIGRAFYIGNHTIMRPYAGFKGLTLDHIRTIRYIGGFLTSNDNQVYKNKFNGLGLQTGLNMQFNIFGIPECTSGCFDLYTNVALAIIAGKDKIYNYEIYGAEPITQISDCYSNAKFMADAAIGLFWNKLMCHNKLNMQLNFNWELHRYPNIWGRQVVGSLSSPIGIFSTQGFVFGIKLNF